MFDKSLTRKSNFGGVLFLPKFSKDFRVELVKEVDQRAYLNSVALKYGVGKTTLKVWMHAILKVA